MVAKSWWFILLVKGILDHKNELKNVEKCI
jgi:hypothetical protein